MAWKVFKRGKRYAIVNAGYDGYILVDVKEGRALHRYWDGTAQAKYDLEELESGRATPETHALYYNPDLAYMGDITADESWPKSLTVMRERLNRAPREPAAAARSLTGRDLVGASVTKDHGTFTTLRMPDGTYAYRLGSGAAVGGFRSASGATLSAKREVGRRSAERLAEMGLDPGSDATETLRAHYRERVREVYSTAVDDMRGKYSAMLEGYERHRLEWEARLAAGEVTRDQFDEWLRRRAWEQDRHSDICGQMARTLADADAEAVRMINGYTPEAYAENFNYATYQVESGAGVSTSFTLYDRDAVLRLIEADRKLVPERSTDDAADLAWNRRKLTEAVTLGIMQGEPAAKVAARIEGVAGMDSRAAMRTARTALTGAQNAGRADAYARAKSMGIGLRQEWQATYDTRTRHSHVMMDGEQAEVGETFSNDLRYPGDPDGPPREVFNCRCTLVPVLGGLDDGGAWRADVTVAGMPYDEWKAYHTRRAPKTVRQLREAVTRLRAKVDDLADRLDKAESNTSGGMLDYYRENLAEAEAKLRELEWAKDLDKYQMMADQNALYDELAEVSKGFGTMEMSDYERADREFGRISGLIDELDRKIEAKRAYDDASFDVRYYRDRVREAEEKRATAKAAVPALKAELAEAVRERNRAYGELSEALPFLPNVREKVGDWYADGMEEVVREAEGRHPEIAAAYRRFSCELNIIDHEHEGGAFYRSSERGVYLNADNDASGSPWEAPYEVASHELGHMMDHISAYGYKFSGAVRGLQEVIKSDWAAYRESFTDWDEERFPTDESKDQEIVRVLKGRMREMDDEEYGSGTLAYGDLSDIVEGCTGIDYPMGIGHGAAYHEGKDATAHEFTAEVYDSAMTKEESYRLMEEVFPNAVAMVVDMTREICS